MMGSGRRWLLQMVPQNMMTTACWPIGVGIGQDAQEFEELGKRLMKWWRACIWLSASLSLQSIIPPNMIMTLKLARIA